MHSNVKLAEKVMYMYIYKIIPYFYRHMSCQMHVHSFDSQVVVFLLTKLTIDTIVKIASMFTLAASQTVILLESDRVGSMYFGTIQ